MGGKLCRKCRKIIPPGEDRCSKCGAGSSNWFQRKGFLTKTLIVFLTLVALLELSEWILGVEHIRKNSQPINASPGELLLNISDIDEAGWQLFQEEGDSVRFVRDWQVSFSVDTLTQEVELHGRKEGAAQAFQNSLPKHLSIESMNVGDESAVWVDSERKNAYGIFRDRNAVCHLHYKTRSDATIINDLKKWAKRAEKKLADY